MSNRSKRRRGTCNACRRTGVEIARATEGWCSACTRRWARAGRPDTGPPPPPPPRTGPSRAPREQEPAGLLYRRGQHTAARLAAGHTPADPTHWGHLGACHGAPDPDQWYPDASLPDTVRAACLACPVLDDCQAWGLARETHGVWGGLLPALRTRIRGATGLPHPDEGPTTTDARTADIGRLLDMGLSHGEIADHLQLTRRTVVRHSAKIRKAAAV